MRDLSMQFRAINQKHDVLTTQATVTEKKVEEGENRVYLDVNVVNQDGLQGAPGKADRGASQPRVARIGRVSLRASGSARRLADFDREW